MKKDLDGEKEEIEKEFGGGMGVPPSCLGKEDKVLKI